MKDMFCFQCQQTAHNTGCEGKAGVCGKKADTANYQDEIIGALIGLSRAAKDGNPTERTDALMEKALFTTITNVNFNDTTIREIISEVQQEKQRISPGEHPDYDMKKLWDGDENIRSLKSLVRTKGNGGVRLPRPCAPAHMPGGGRVLLRGAVPDRRGRLPGIPPSPGAENRQYQPQVPGTP